MSIAVILLAVSLFLPGLRYAGPLVHAHPGIIHVPADYAKIQDAVNAASPGDTVLVSNGLYKENIIVSKSINLTGTSRDSTVVDAQGQGLPGIVVNGTSKVSIQNFTVNDTGTILFLGEPNAGIYVNSSSKINILDNRIMASTVGNGIELVNSNLVNVENNLVTTNLRGIVVQGGFGNIVRDNNSTSNSFAVIVGDSRANKVTENFLGKGQYGIDLEPGSIENIVERNIIANNTISGLKLYGANDNLVTDNNIDFNKASGSYPGEGIFVQGAGLNRIYHNNIRSNTIQVFYTTPPGDANIWDNATGQALKNDVHIKFVNATNTSTWHFNNTIIYDTNNNGKYEPGEPVIASVSTTPPPPGTLLQTDPLIKFVDRNGTGVWGPSEPVVYDSNGNGIVDAGEPVLAWAGGNYWSDYTGRDNGANGFALNGIGDTKIPHPCPNGGNPCTGPGGAGGVDWYPLMTALKPSTFNVTASANIVRGVTPLTVSFTGVVRGGTSPYIYYWDFGGGHTRNTQNAMYTFQTAGNYTVSLTVRDAASNTAIDYVPLIVVSNTVSVTISFSPSSPFEQQSVFFIATVTGGLSPYTYAWSFGDGSTNTTNPASHTYSTKGTYSVKVNATDSNGTIGSASTSITVAQSTTTGPPGGGSNLLLTIAAIVAAAIALGLIIFLRLRRRGTAQKEIGQAVKSPG